MVTLGHACVTKPAVFAAWWLCSVAGGAYDSWPEQNVIVRVISHACFVIRCRNIVSSVSNAEVCEEIWHEEKDRYRCQESCWQ